MKAHTKDVTFNNINYLNLAIDRRNKGDYNAMRVINLWYDEFGTEPTLNGLRSEINRLQRWLYKDKDHIERIKLLKSGLTFLKFIGLELYLETI